MFETVLEYLNKKEVENKENIKMSSISPIGIGGAARLVVFPKTEEELICSVCLLEESDVKYRIVGRMSNILPCDSDFCGAIVRTDRLCGISVKDNHLIVPAGASLPCVSRVAARAFLSGFEELSGIPGSVGGSVLGNAGAFGRSVSDIIFGVSVYDLETKKILHLSKNELVFSYRHCSLRDMRYVLLSAELALAHGTEAKIYERISDFARIRRSTQPNEPSLGSVFKRGETYFASRLVDLCGLKGRRVGGAAISEKHAGFIVNKGNATAEDVKQLARIAEEQVLLRFGIVLEREIEYLEE